MGLRDCGGRRREGGTSDLSSGSSAARKRQSDGRGIETEGKGAVERERDSTGGVRKEKQIN